MIKEAYVSFEAAKLLKEKGFNCQRYNLINRGSTLDLKILSEFYAGYKTYKEAVEAAFKYCRKFDLKYKKLL